MITNSSLADADKISFGWDRFSENFVL